MTKRKENPVIPTGKKDGPATRKTRSIADEMASSGRKMPLEVMAENMTWYMSQADMYWSMADDIDVTEWGKPASKERREAEGRKMGYEALGIKFRILGQQAASDCAPYVHAKLQAMKLTGDKDQPIIFQVAGADARL